MKFEEMRDRGRRMTAEQITANLKGLARDPRFAAVIGWIENNREMFVVAGSSQRIAGDHGKLAHNGGSIHTCNVMIGQLAKVVKGVSRGGMAQPEEEQGE